MSVGAKRSTEQAEAVRAIGLFQCLTIQYLASMLSVSSHLPNQARMQPHIPFFKHPFRRWCGPLAHDVLDTRIDSLNRDADCYLDLRNHSTIYSSSMASDE